MSNPTATAPTATARTARTVRVVVPAEGATPEWLALVAPPRSVPTVRPLVGQTGLVEEVEVSWEE